MKQFNIKVDGIEHLIEYEGNSMRIDNIPFVVGQSGGMITLDGIAYDVTLEDNIARVDGQKYTVEFKGLKTRTTNKKEVRKPKAKAKKGSVLSLMPGTILKILVKEGGAVKTGDVLLILEAMKMENEVAADHDGVIEKIHVQVGDKVDEGQALMDIK